MKKLLALLLLACIPAFAQTQGTSLRATNGVAYGHLVVQDHLSATNSNKTNTFAGKFQTGTGRAASPQSVAMGIGTIASATAGSAHGLGTEVYGSAAFGTGITNIISSSSPGGLVSGRLNFLQGAYEFASGSGNLVDGTDSAAIGTSIIYESDSHHTIALGQNINVGTGAGSNFVWNSDGLNTYSVPSSKTNSFLVHVPSSGTIAFSGAPLASSNGFIGTIIPLGSNNFVGAFTGNGSGLTNITGLATSVTNWINDLVGSVNQHFYFSAVTNTGVSAGITNCFTMIDDPVITAGTNSISVDGLAGVYFQSRMTTNTISRIEESPIELDMWLYLSGSGPVTATAHPEIYIWYPNDTTQEISSANDDTYSSADGLIHFTQGLIVTNSYDLTNGCKLAVRWKITSETGIGTTWNSLVGNGYGSHISLNSRSANSVYTGSFIGDGAGLTNGSPNFITTNTVLTASNPSTNGYGGYTTNEFPLALVGFTNGVAKWEKRPKVYRALLTQSGTSAPTDVVLENSLGSVVWTRSAEGIYLGTLSGAFVAAKTFLNIGNVCVSPTGDGLFIVRGVVLDSTDAVQVRTVTPDLIEGDGNLGKTPVEILVYP